MIKRATNRSSQSVIVFFTILVVTFVVTAEAGSDSRRGYNDALPKVARYTTVAPVPSLVERDPLSVLIEINFPPRVRTVGDAVNHLLSRSGYHLASTEVSDPLMPTLLEAELPEVHRDIGPITLERALTTIAGEPWELVQDPVHRLVSFELKPDYRISYGLMSQRETANMVQLAGADPSEFLPGSDEYPEQQHPFDFERQSDSPSEDAGSVYRPSSRTTHYTIDENAEEQYRQDQAQLMNAKIAIDLRDLTLIDAIRRILPPGWDVDLAIVDSATANARVDLTGQTTRKQILIDLLRPLSLKAEFYPAMRPLPLVVVSEEK